MKRIRIIKKFRDVQRYNRIYPLGHEYDTTEERAEELIAKGWAEPVGDVVKVTIKNIETQTIDKRTIKPTSTKRKKKVNVKA